MLLRAPLTPSPCQGISAGCLLFLALKFLTRMYSDSNPFFRSADTKIVLHRGISFPGTAVLEMWAHTTAAEVSDCCRCSAVSSPILFLFHAPAPMRCSESSVWGKEKRAGKLQTLCDFHISSPAAFLCLEWCLSCMWWGDCAVPVYVWALGHGQGHTLSLAPLQRRASWITHVDRVATSVL